MNPTLTFCSQPTITTTQTTYPIGDNLSLQVNRFANEEGGTTDDRNLLYYNIIYPNGDTTSLTEYTSSEDDTLSVKNNLSLADSGKYYIRFRQSGCSTKLDSIIISVEQDCNTPAITTTDTVLTLGETLKLDVTKLQGIGVIPESKILFTGPNNFRAGPWSWDSITGSSEDYEFTLLTNFKAFNAGKYYATFITEGCDNVTDSIILTLSTNLNYKNLPLVETFDQFRENWDYPNWTFKGKLNGANNANKGYWFGTLTKYNKQYNCLLHNPGAFTEYKSDTVLSSVYLNNATDTTDLNLEFYISNGLNKISSISYDTLIVNAYFSQSKIPTRLYKKGGMDLCTSIPKGSIHIPEIENNISFRVEKINLSNYDTCSSIKLEFIHKPSLLLDTASSTMLLDNILLYSLRTDTTKLIPPTISVDSIVNYDFNFNLSVKFPSKHKAYGYRVMYRPYVTDEEIKWGTENLLPAARSSLFRFQTLVPYQKINNPLKDTTINIPFRFFPNNVYEMFVATYDSVEKTITRYTNNPGSRSNKIITMINRDYQLKKPILIVDSIYNNDKNFRLTLNIPKNSHGFTYEIYEDNNSIYSGAIRLITTDSTLIYNDTTIVLDRIGLSNGTRKYKARLNNIFIDTTFSESSILNVTVDYSNIPLGIPQLSADSVNNKDKNFNLSISLPSNNNGDEYGLIENNKTIESIKITDTKSSINKTISLTNKSNGTYTYNSYIKRGTRVVKSLPINITVNYTIPPALACTSEVVTASNKTKTNFTYSFKLNKNCSNTGYKAVFYAGNNANGFLANNPSLVEAQVKLLTWTPTNGTTKNGFGTTGNIQLTQNEIKTGFFNRKVDTPLSFGNRWYRVDIICTSCNQLNKTKTAYFYVTN